jgi:hypothetical protein
VREAKKIYEVTYTGMTPPLTTEIRATCSEDAYRVLLDMRVETSSIESIKEKSGEV